MLAGLTFAETSMSDVKNYGAVGDGKADDTKAIQHAIASGVGVIEFGRGTYRITETILVDLAKTGRTSLTGSGGVAKIVHAGKGPAFFFRGTHSATADPSGFRPEEWERERMPIVSNLEIEGKHAEADGIRVEGVMQPTFVGVLIREVRTALHVTGRARNIVVSACHFYNNKGIGVHFDTVNLHQAIITGSHISYCRLGGIRVERSEIRNFQITGCDIEYNNNRAHKVPDADDVPTAEIYLDVGQGSIREGTIVGNTIQATYSPNGANIRFIGAGPDKNHKIGMWSITGNLIGSQETNIHLSSARDVTISGNHIYSGHKRNLLVEDSRNIVVGANCFGHNPDYQANELCTGIRFVNSVDCVLSGTLIQDCQSGKHTVPNVAEIQREALVEFVKCQRVNLTGVQIVDGAPHGILLDACSDTLLSGCTILDSRETKLMKSAIRWTGEGSGNLVSGCRLDPGSEGKLDLPQHVTQSGNLVG
jgi:hypothetical protein